jgi:hypothetical protein
LFTFTDASTGDWTLAFEYWDGSAWTALSSVVDGTTELTLLGFRSISWAVPGDWAVTTLPIMPDDSRYYMRVRVDSLDDVFFPSVRASRVWIGIPLTVDGPARGTHAWRTNAGAARLAIGAADSIFVYSEGVLDDITPASGFTAGIEDATFAAGNFGAGPFGVGPFGVGDDTLEELVEATTWQIDNYGEDLVLVALADGDLWYFDQDGGGDMAPITPSAGTVPTSNLGVVVTPENFIVALGAGGNRRRIMWADQTDYTDWDITSLTNTAGDLLLPSRGAIFAARRAQSETLIWTETDLIALRYVGGAFIYSPVPVGQDGAISRRSMAVIDTGAVWMGQNAFFQYDGYTKPLPSDMSDYVFGDLNRVQASKVWAETRAEFGEVVWHYPSASSTECDRAVVYNRRMGIWYPLEYARTAGEDRGALPYSVAVDPDGLVWQHESGRTYPGVATLPYAETGPVEIGDGPMYVSRWIPDERTLGELELTLTPSRWPTAADGTPTTLTPASQRDLRLTAGQLQLKVSTSEDHPDADWRLGTVRLDVSPAGGRR